MSMEKLQMESSLPTTFPTSKPSPTVTDDEFNLFHSIDRKLYTRLIINLGRDPKESMQVMAFWLWLEQEVVDDLTLVNKMLCLPFPLVNKLANETVMCLKCVESDKFPFLEATHELVLLPNFVNRNVSFQYFYENRIGVLKGVTRMIGEVCSRAFHDILEKTIRNGFFPAVNVGSSRTTAIEKASHGGFENRPLMAPKGGHHHEVGSSSNSSSRGSPMVTQNPYQAQGYQFWHHPHYPTQQQPMGMGSHVFPMDGTLRNAQQSLSGENNFQGYAGNEDVHDAELDAIIQVFRSSLNLLDDDDFNVGVFPDERTIFLTFSKGYPISETEVRDFFTRKFGDFIESVHMQEVGEDEQVLFARVVARSAAIVDAVVFGGRAKYNINGKHVWARKYARKQKSPPPRDQLGGALSIH